MDEDEEVLDDETALTARLRKPSILFLGLALILFIRLRPFGDPTGADGYFYLKQIDSLSRSASFYYRDYSAAFFPPALLNVVLRDPALAYRVATLAVFAAIGATVARLVERGSESLGKRSPVWRWAFVAYALVFFATGNLFLELNLVFLKTGFAVLALIVGLERFLAGRMRAAVVSGIVAVFSHKIMIALVPAAAVVLLFDRKRISARSTGIGAAVVAIGLGAAFLVQPRLFEHFSHLFDRLDLSAFSPETFSEMPTAAGFGIALLLAGILGVTLARVVRERAPTASKVLAFAGGLALLSFFFPAPLNTDGARYRLELVAVPFFAVIVGMAARFGGAYRFFAFPVAVIPIALGLVFNRPLGTWVTPWSERIVGEGRLRDVVPANAVLYAPHGAEFYLAYRTPLRPRSLRIDPKGREIFRVAYVLPYLGGEGAKRSLLANDLETTALLKLGNEFYVFREEDWLALGRIHLFIPHRMNLLPEKPAFVADYD